MTLENNERTLPELAGPPDLGRAVPVLPLSVAPAFPDHLQTAQVTDEASIAVLRAIPDEPQPVVLLFDGRSPGEIGVVARVIGTSGHESGNYALFLEGLARVELVSVEEHGPCPRAHAVLVTPPEIPAEELERVLAEVRETVLRFVDLKPELPAEARDVVLGSTVLEQLVDLVGARLPIPAEEKIALVTTLDLRERAALLLDILGAQIPQLEERQRASQAIDAAGRQLWVFEPGSAAELERATAAGEMSAEEAAQLAYFCEHGFLVMEGLVPSADVDALVSDVRSVHLHPGSFVLSDHQNGQPFRFSTSEDDHFESLYDLYVNFESARAICYHPTILRFLELLFRCKPVAFQQLLFQRSNGHPLHQDTAYVCAEEPLLMAASWIALEDVVEGRGELTYFAGSHRIEPFRFSDGSRRYRHGADDPAVYGAHLERQCKEHGCEQRSFLAKKGDVFLWAADLVHGSNPRTRPIEETRMSCVTHYLADTTEPFWFRGLADNRRSMSYRNDRAKIASSYYELPKGPGLATPNFQLPNLTE